MPQTLSNVDHGETLYNEKDKIKLRMLKVLFLQNHSGLGKIEMVKERLCQAAAAAAKSREGVGGARSSRIAAAGTFSAAPQIHNCTFSLLCRSTIVHSCCSTDRQLYILSALQIYNCTFALHNSAAYSLWYSHVGGAAHLHCRSTLRTTQFNCTARAHGVWNWIA